MPPKSDARGKEDDDWLEESSRRPKGHSNGSDQPTSPGNAADKSVDRDGRSTGANERDTPRDYSPDPPERPVKRIKRGKYISRACTSCQRRKIKCEGGEPCTQCIARKLPCTSVPRGRLNSVDERTDSGQSKSGADNSHISRDTMVHGDVLGRLVEVERKINMLQACSHESMACRDHSHHHARVRSAGDYQTPASTELEDILEADGQTFAGELSINLASGGVAEGLDMASKSSPSTLNELPGSSLLHQRPKSLGGSGPFKVRGWLEGILDNYGIVADECEWRQSLNVFLDEVHILYPILHPPTLWDIFHGMWENSALWDMTSPAEREHKRLSVALVCFCLALGRCSAPTRMTDASGVRSTGWALYSMGVSLMQDAVGLSNTAAKSLLTLQLLLLRVLYLFRLDATQRAARLLAMAVSNAHIIGLHRQRTLDGMSAFSSQMYCRTWWSLYVLDRRIALESGQPYLIQDSNVDTSLPFDLSDQWLSRFASATEKVADLQREIVAEVATNPMTSIPYLIVRVRFSRIVGKAWELLYGIKSSNTTSNAMIEYTDTMLSRLLDKIPSDLSYDPALPPDGQLCGRPRWRIKQTMVLNTCCTFLRLLIRSLSLSSQKSGNRTEDDELESLTVCATLAASILNTHENLTDDNLKHSFPFSHYLISTTMVMTALVSREKTLKRRYREVILAATRSLNLYCHKIWVSGKMIRWVSQLSLLVRQTLLDDATDSQPSQGVDVLRQDYRPGHGAGDKQHLPSPPDIYSLLQAHGRSENSANATESRGGLAALDNESVARSGIHPGRANNNNNNGADMDPWGAEAGGAESRPEMPDWGLSDLGFDAVVNMGAGFCLDENTPDLSIQSDDVNMASLRGDSFDLSGDMHDAIFGALRLNGVFGLDIDVDQTTVNSSSPMHMRF